MHQGGARAGVPRLVWTVSISESGLAWASLGMGGIAGVWHVFLLCCWSDDGTSFWDTRYIHTTFILILPFIRLIVRVLTQLMGSR